MDHTPVPVPLDKTAFDIFLSYSRADKEIMLRIKAILEKEDLSVWIDQTEIPPGTPNWRRAIQHAIHKSRCLVVILSPTSNESRWVNEELDYAELQKKQIFGVLVRGVEGEAIPFGYSRLQYIDLRNEHSYSEHMKSLITEIFKTVGGAPTFQTKQCVAESVEHKMESHPPPSASLSLSAPRRHLLSPHNIRDWWRVLWLILVTPQDWQTYKQINEVSLRGTTRRLVSTLIWSPLLILATGRGLGTLPSDGQANMFIFSGIILVLWRITVWVDYLARGRVAALIGSMAFFVAFGVAAAVTGGVAFALTFGMAVVGAIVVAGSIAYSVAEASTFLISVGVVTGTLIGVVDAFDNVTAFGIAALGTLSLVIVIARIVKHQILSGKPTFVGKMLLIFLVLAYAICILHSYFGM